MGTDGAPEDFHPGSVIETDEGASTNAMDYLRGLSTTHKKVPHIGMGVGNVPHVYHFLEPDVVARTKTWINNVPDGCDLADPRQTREIGIEILKDWMNWSKYSALSWIKKLDEYERRFRIAALEYHKVPSSLRHSPTLRHGSKIEQGTLKRLKQIFETDRPRGQQSFFITWLEINNTARTIMDEIDSPQPFAEDAAVLRATLDRFKADISRLEKPLRILEMSLDWLEATVARVVSRSPTRGMEQLEAKHSREGTLFRQWIQTLPEIEQGFVKSSQYTEFYVEQLLESGVEREAYWSMLVNGGQGRETPSAS